MELPDPKKLRAFLKVLRAEGVVQYASTAINITFGDTPPVDAKSKAQELMEGIDDAMDEPMTEEEMNRIMFYSSDAPVEDPKE